jgi:hypothetical protein
VTRNAYLRAGRLEDVLFLIQYLGLGKSYSVERDSKPDGVAPRSSSDGLWVSVARDHPEFFRVTDKDSVVLAMRYYQRDASGSPPPVSIELVQQLIENAIALQERQAKRSEVWKVWGTFIAAVVAALLGIVQLFLGHK